MSSFSTPIFALLAVIIVCTAVSAAARRPVPAWNYYHFDGRAFVAGQPADNGPFLAVRERTVPVVLTRAAKPEATAMPAGKGALAGICFIQSSGGKLADSGGYTPRPGMPVTISSGNRVAASLFSDEHGYFVAVLAAGSYRISNGVFMTEALVERGTTVLVPLLAGKRMVD